MSRRPPRLATLLIRIAVPKRDRAFVLEDLREEYDALLGEGIGRGRAARWYWKQVLASIPSSVRRTRTPPKRGRAAFLHGLGQDVRLGIRSLVRRPVFTLTAAGTLALGLGAITTMFSVVHGVLLRPLPYPDQDRLVGVWHTAPGLGMPILHQTTGTYLTYRDDNRVFESIGLWDNTLLTVTGLDAPEQVDAIIVSDAVLPMLGVVPTLGRLFSDVDVTPGAPWTVLVTEAFWRSRLGGTPDVVGRRLVLNGVSAEVIGVVPSGFRFLDYAPAVFIPLRIDPSTIRGIYTFTYQAVARLRPDVTLEAANADLARMIPLTLERFSGGVGISLEEMETVGFGPNVHPLKDDLVGDVGGLLWILFGSVGVVLLIACANVANLFLVRADDRRREVAVRAALGAAGGRLARYFLVESGLVAALGGAVGLAIASLGLDLLVRFGPERLPRLAELSLDPIVFVFGVGIGLAGGVLFAVYPVVRMRRLELATALKEVGRGAGTSRERQRMRSALVASQLAFAVLLLVGAGLMVRSLVSMLAVQPGFERPDEVLALRINVPAALMPSDAEVVRMHERILDDIRLIPGVTSAGLSSSVTMDGWDDNNAIYVEDAPVANDEVPPIRQIKYVSDGYFATMGNGVLAGRAISRDDIRQRAAVVMVTANFAREYWRSPDEALGRRVAESWQGPWFEIVGVVGDVHDDGVDREPTAVVYWPIAKRDESSDGFAAQRSLGYAIRSPRVGDPAFLDEIRQAVWQVNPDLPVANVATLNELRRRSMARASFTVVMLAIAAGVAVLLGMVGVYGVMSYAVAQRTREIGVRMAFGATSRDVGGLVLRDAGVLVLLGTGVGLTAAAGLTRLMRALLYGVSPLDPLTFVGGAVVLIGVALLAGYLPARRASRVDPMEALRWE